MSDNVNIPYLDKSFIAHVGTDQLEKLQFTLSYMLSTGGIDKTAIETKLRDKSPLSEQERATLYLLGFLQAAFKQAQLDGKVLYKPLESIINTSSSPDFSV